MHKTIIASAFVLLCTTVLAAEGEISFTLDGKLLRLGGAFVLKTQSGNNMRLAIAAKDSKAKFSIAAELPANLPQTLSLSTQSHTLSLVMVTAQGIYSVAPYTQLSRDHFMRYVERVETPTTETEDDPDDRPETRIAECRQGLSEKCQKLAAQNRKKRPKKRIEYRKVEPQWVKMSNEDRLVTGSGVYKEEKFRDTLFFTQLQFTFVNGKPVAVTGQFSGVVLFNEGGNPPVKKTITQGAFSLPIKEVP